MVLINIGNFCGYSETFEKYKYLFIYDITLPAKNPYDVWVSGVCVKSCPTIDFVGEDEESETVACRPTKWLLNRNKK